MEDKQRENPETCSKSGYNWTVPSRTIALNHSTKPSKAVPKYTLNIMMPALPDEAHRPKPTGLIDASSGRVWTCKAVNQLVIGRMYGSYNLTMSCRHLRLSSQDLSDLTNAEVFHFWNLVVINSSAFAWWSNRIPGDDGEVQKVLEEIKALLDQAG